jgi:hypothetical protein
MVEDMLNRKEEEAIYCLGQEIELAQLAREAKAVEMNNAEVPVHLWNDRIKTCGCSKS